MDIGSLFAEFIKFGKSQQSIKYAYFASLTLALAEGFQCFASEELSLIWTAKWNLGKGLYILARYIVFIELAIPGLYLLPSGLSPLVCCQRMFAAATSILNSVEVSAAEAILFLRVYALGGTDRRLGAFLLLKYLGVHIAAYTLLYKFLNSIVCKHPSPFPSVISCLPIKVDNRMLSIVFILILASEIVILLLTFWLCFTKHKSTNSPLVGTFSRDGLYYFVLISAMSAGNIICNLVAPAGYVYLLSIPQMVLHSTLSTRMVLHIRKVGNGVYNTKGEVALQEVNTSEGPRTLHSMQFAAAPQSRSKGSSTAMSESGLAA
ncbi:hypothetical protein DFP72DRAFT_888213 [Ephemerocybe angulata]|uniref:DUF6533 domain-containing protein n=1 Tax=Ephemerocybe angulata TaxID=980116 RepID=A0A8H6I3B9_9AGAR|nr:hypothetical protein DFP72DRAFT_888213 [Tulosesus angulatus]